MIGKRKNKWFLILVCMMLLAGCGKAKDGQSDIGNNNPGIVDMGSEDKEEATVHATELPAETDKTWEVAQYGPRDINSSFYTIYNEEEGLIVIDGGWTEDADFVKDVIASYGGHVEAWILTHPHQDHIGAFNAIYPNPGEITIGEIYTVDMASPEDCLAVASWDSVEAYEDFLSLHIPDIKYLYPGDKMELCGLELEVFSAFDDNVRIFSRDYLNDGSMMFKVSGKKESFLFCADVGVSMSDFLLQKYGQQLKADYLQMAHHGFGGLNDNFYSTVAPAFAFFDAPDWLMYDTTGKYDTPEHVELMQGMGSEIFSFSQGTNSILLE